MRRAAGGGWQATQALKLPLSVNGTSGLMRRVDTPAALLAISFRGRPFTTRFMDKVSDAVSDSVAAITRHAYFADERLVTEPRRKVELFHSSAKTLAQRVAAQRSVSQHVVPSEVTVSKDKTSIAFVWPREAVEAAEAEQEKRARAQLGAPPSRDAAEHAAGGTGTSADPVGPCRSHTVAHSSSSETAGESADGQPQLQTRALAEYLRAYTTSTDGRYGMSNTTIYGRRGLTITDVYPIGNYALRVSFSDGHNGGLYTYEYLYFLTSPANKYGLMRDYIRELRTMRKSRDPPRRAPSRRRLANVAKKGEAQEDGVGRRAHDEKREASEGLSEGSHLAPAFPRD